MDCKQPTRVGTSEPGGERAGMSKGLEMGQTRAAAETSQVEVCAQWNV